MQPTHTQTYKTKNRTACCEQPKWADTRTTQTPKTHHQQPPTIYHTGVVLHSCRGTAKPSLLIPPRGTYHRPQLQLCCVLHITRTSGCSACTSAHMHMHTTMQLPGMPSLHAAAAKYGRAQRLTGTGPYSQNHTTHHHHSKPPHCCHTQTPDCIAGALLHPAACSQKQAPLPNQHERIPPRPKHPRVPAPKSTSPKHGPVTLMWLLATRVPNTDRHMNEHPTHVHPNALP
jgi:hypothetical protein